MSTSFYDVLIAGTELPGLILGALCAKKGYRVLVIGQGCRRNRYLYGPHVFRRRPFLMTSMDSSPPAREVLGELSLALDLRNRPRRCEPSYQWISPHHRFDCGGRADRIEAELNREFPGEFGPISEFISELRRFSSGIDALLKRNPTLPPDGWSERRDYQKLAAEFPAFLAGVGLSDPLELLPPEHPFRFAALAPALFGASVDLQEGPIIPRARLVSHYADGLLHLDGGLDAYRDIFVQKLRQHASDFRPDVALDGLIIKRGKVVEGLVRDRRESIGCNLLVCNSDLRRFFQLVPAEHQRERYHHRIHALQPSHYLFTLNVALAREGLPEGLAHNAFVANPGRRLFGDEDLMLLQVEDEPTPPPAKGQRAGTSAPASVTLTLTCRLRARSFAPSVSFAGELTHRVLSRLRESIFPFLDEHLLAVHCPWITVDPMTGEQRFDPSELIALYRGSTEETLDASLLPVLTEYRNILVCNESVFGGFGLEGAYLAALNAYRRVTQLVVLKTLIS